MEKPLTFEFGNKVDVEVIPQEKKFPLVTLTATGPLTFTYDELTKFTDALINIMKLTAAAEGLVVEL